MNILDYRSKCFTDLQTEEFRLEEYRADPRFCNVLLCSYKNFQRIQEIKEAFVEQLKNDFTVMPDIYVSNKRAYYLDDTGDLHTTFILTTDEPHNSASA